MENQSIIDHDPGESSLLVNKIHVVFKTVPGAEVSKMFCCFFANSLGPGGSNCKQVVNLGLNKTHTHTHKKNRPNRSPVCFHHSLATALIHQIQIEVLKLSNQN